MDLPPTAERCSLKTSEYYINSIDTSKIHNMKGIDVWANNPPKPWNEKSSTLPRSKYEFQMGRRIRIHKTAENTILIFFQATRTNSRAAC